jgi:exosome complex RNA-binding protein Rrp4
VAIGVNGVVWIKSDDVQSTVIIRNAIINASSGQFTDLEIDVMIEKLVAVSKARIQND